ncbi:MAG: hypothetical protein KDC67_15030 [Ignavibacteriae bacterium]|nr:hypothetical protein [Ignavibacteriota bacterium]
MLILISSFWTIWSTAQNNEPLIGHWELQKISFKKTAVNSSEKNKEQLLDIYKSALYDQLTNEQQSTFEDLEWTNSEAEKLIDIFYLTTIEFKSNGALYNTSLNLKKSLSGEYLFDKKKLYVEWETAEKINFKVLKNSATELILKDIKLKITYYFIKSN